MYIPPNILESKSFVDFINIKLIMYEVIRCDAWDCS